MTAKKSSSEPMLTMSSAEFQSIARGLVRKGEKLLDPRPRGHAAYVAAEQAHGEWREQVSALLRRAFTNDLYVQKFEECDYDIAQPDPDAPTPEWIDYLIEAVESDLACLAKCISPVKAGLVREEAESATSSPSVRQLLAALKRFPDGVLRLRNRRMGKADFNLADEWDVQDALWLYLKMAFDDAKAEDATPAHAGRSNHIDFVVPSVNSAIEVKFARSQSQIANLGDELKADIADVEKRRTDIRFFIVFVVEVKAVSAAVLDELAGKSGRLPVHVVRVRV